MTADKSPRRCLMTFDGEYILRFNKFLQPTAIEKGQHEFVLSSDYDALAAERDELKERLDVFRNREYEAKNTDELKAELSREKKKVEKLRDALRFYADANNWMVTTKDELHEARRTIIGDVESYGYQRDEWSLNILQIIAGKTAREALEGDK